MAFTHRFAASVDDLNAHITKSSNAHNATSISTSIEIDGNTYTNVYDALEALAAGGGGGGGSAPDATDTIKGILKLTNHLSGTAALPKVVQFELTTALDHDPQTPGSLAYYIYDGYDDELNPTYKWSSMPKPVDADVNDYYLGYDDLNNAPKWELTSSIGGSVVDATTGVKGIVQLAGDIAGSATSVIVKGLRGITVANVAPSPNQALIYSSGTSSWEPTTIPTQTATGAAGGDLGGTYPNPTVNKLRSVSVSASAPANGQALIYDSGLLVWAPTTIPTQTATGAAGGDLSGTYPNPTVAKINSTTVPAGGALTTGQILRVSGASAMTYGALDLANANAITGTIPVGNLPSASTGAKGVVQLAGDIAGTSTAVTVTKANGATIPVAGSLTTGNVLRVSGASALSYAAINLAGGANHVTGVLPIANIAQGTANYILTGAGATTPVYQNSITAMTNVGSSKFTMNPTSGTAGYTETLYDTFSTTSNTQFTARTVSFAASQAAVITVCITGVDGYTTYGGTNRVLSVTKAIKCYRGSAGTLVAPSGFSLAVDLTPSWNESPVVSLDFVVSTNDLLIKVTGESTFNAKWSMDTTIRWVVL